jgi:hypothetical protein
MRSPGRELARTGIPVELAAAQAELAAAEALFNMAREPALVDHAIHRLLAAEGRLGYLLHLARAEAHDA